MLGLDGSRKRWNTVIIQYNLISYFIYPKIYIISNAKEAQKHCTAKFLGNTKYYRKVKMEVRVIL